jgi:hypothetical protein
MDKTYSTMHDSGDWDLGTGNGLTVERIAVLMLSDIRRELRKLNAILACPNFQAIPRKLDRISKNTAKPRKRNSKASRREKR